MFRVVDHSEREPALNLAIDEAILNAVEADEAPDTLRFWESPSLFAVIGVGQKIAEEANLEACAEDDVPVHRRCSAGGAVLQGPGSLNYTLCLRYDSWPECRVLRESYCAILKSILNALKTHRVTATIEGTSDLAIDGMKFSGNAQKRKRNAFLHHGTLLYGDAPLPFTRYLREPKQRPEYRGARDHDGFVRRLPFEAAETKSVIHGAFGGPDTFISPLEPAIIDAARALAAEKYADHAWIQRR